MPDKLVQWILRESPLDLKINLYLARQLENDLFGTNAVTLEGSYSSTQTNTADEQRKMRIMGWAHAMTYEHGSHSRNQQIPRYYWKLENLYSIIAWD